MRTQGVEERGRRRERKSAWGGVGSVGEGGGVLECVAAFADWFFGWGSVFPNAVVGVVGEVRGRIKPQFLCECSEIYLSVPVGGTRLQQPLNLVLRAPFPISLLQPLRLLLQLHGLFHPPSLHLQPVLLLRKISRFQLVLPLKIGSTGGTHQCIINEATLVPSWQRGPSIRRSAVLCG